MREKSMFVLGLLDAKKPVNSQMNYSIWLLTIPSHLLTLSPRPKDKSFAPLIICFSAMARVLHMRLLVVVSFARIVFLKFSKVRACLHFFNKVHTKDWSVICIICWQWKLFPLEKVSASVTGRVANGVAIEVPGRCFLCCQGVTKTGLLFGWNFISGIVRQVAIDNMNLMVEQSR